MIEGTQGYERVGVHKLGAWHAVALETSPAPALRIMGRAAGRALDVGAGSGRVAAWLAARGWRVDAAEPMAVFRQYAAVAHATAGVRWLDSALPGLRGLKAGAGYDLITCLAVLSHLDDSARRASLERFAELLKPGGALIVSLRLGAGPAERRHFEPDRDVFADSAAASGLTLLFETDAESVQTWNRDAGTRWLWMGFER